MVESGGEDGFAPLDKLAIMGPGLLGGSIALAAEERRLAKSISMWGRRENSLDAVRAAGKPWELTTEAPEAVWDADLVILCVPVGAMAAVTEAAAPALSENAIVTDVGSVKKRVVDQLAPLLRERARFVASHPMAGSERTGFGAARADLFENAMTVLTPVGETDPADTARTAAFWRALGCRTAELAPDRHDALVAQISHVPHAVASALVHAAAAEARPLVGTGFLDSTRIAAGDPGMWTEILSTNSTAVEEGLGNLIGELEQLRSFLASGDEKGLHEWLALAKDVRSQWPARRSGSTAPD